MLLVKIKKSPSDFNEWIAELGEEDRHCVRLVLIVTNALIRGIEHYARLLVNGEDFERLKNNKTLIDFLRIVRYDVLNQLLKEMKNNHGELKGNLKAPLKCDCLLN